jgi:signal transduction histidine kinase
MVIPEPAARRANRPCAPGRKQVPTDRTTRRPKASACEVFAMSSMQSETQGDVPPRLYVVSTNGQGVLDNLSPSLLSWFSSHELAEQIDEVSAPVDSPLSPSVVLADFRADPAREFSDADLLSIGRIGARLPHAVVAVLTPELNPRVQRLIQQGGINHLYPEPIDWEILGGHLRNIAQRLAKRAGESTFAESGLLEVCLAIGSTLELEALLSKILDLMLSTLIADQGSILLFDRETDRLQMLASRGLPEDITRKGYIPRKGSIAEWVIDNNEPLLLAEQVQDSRFQAMGDHRAIVSSMCIPLRARGDVQGTINLNRLAPGTRFTENDLSTATIFAAQAAVSIENARLYESNLQAERLATVGQTVAGVSHSMRSIVTSLRGGISICEEARGRRDWDLLDKGWGLLQRNYRRLSSMALEMLDYSKSKREPVKTVFEIEPVIREVFATASSRLGDKEIVFSDGVDPEAAEINADQDQIFRAILNLIENAVDAIEKSGTVNVSVTRRTAEAPGESIPIVLGPSKAAILIEVEDSGPGVEPEKLKQIFTPFYTTKGSKGTGLGLAATEKAIQEHLGKILVESEPGKGTRFTIILPA